MHNPPEVFGSSGYDVSEELKLYSANVLRMRGNVGFGDY